MFIVLRALSGGASASVQAVGAGTIADIWEVRERGRAMGLFYLGPLMGPLLAPIIGGALAQSLRWRSTLWFLVIYGGVMVVLIVFALPEVCCDVGARSVLLTLRYTDTESHRTEATRICPGNIL